MSMGGIGKSRMDRRNGGSEESADRARGLSADPVCTSTARQSLDVPALLRVQTPVDDEDDEELWAQPKRPRPEPKCGLSRSLARIAQSQRPLTLCAADWHRRR
jgi:hypothetical protein